MRGAASAPSMAEAVYWNFLCIIRQWDSEHNEAKMGPVSNMAFIVAADTPKQRDERLRHNRSIEQAAAARLARHKAVATRQQTGKQAASTARLARKQAAAAVSAAVRKQAAEDAAAAAAAARAAEAAGKRPLEQAAAPAAGDDEEEAGDSGLTDYLEDANMPHPAIVDGMRVV